MTNQQLLSNRNYKKKHIILTFEQSCGQTTP